MNTDNRMRFKLQVLIALCVIGLFPGMLLPNFVQAASGLPNSSKFGYGARIDPWGLQLEVGLRTASQIGLDWIGIDFDWNRLWPDSSATLDLSELNQVMDYAQENELSVLLSISHAPAWAITPAGPEPELTAGLLAQLSRLYPDTLLAIELFPAANTFEGWGATPDPGSYAHLLEVATQTLQSSGHAIFLVAAGLTPIDPSTQPTDMDDLEFLDELYHAGAGANMEIIGVRLPETDLDPFAAPAGKNQKILRHYETIRAAMLEHGYPDNSIWITGFTWPEGMEGSTGGLAISTAEAVRLNDDAEANWLSRALQMMKSQLYIGVAFHQCLNPSSESINDQRQGQCLLRSEDGQVITHPGVNTLGQVIALGNPNLPATVLEKKLTPDRSKSLLKQSAP